MLADKLLHSAQCESVPRLALILLGTGDIIVEQAVADRRGTRLDAFRGRRRDGDGGILVIGGRRDFSAAAIGRRWREDARLGQQA
jgi:hypothetical protein